jgi:hypothetical protein
LYAVRERVKGSGDKKSPTTMTPVFGASLEDRLAQEISSNHSRNIPIVVENILTEIISRGPSKGLFREVGNVSKVAALKEAINNG